MGTLPSQRYVQHRKVYLYLLEIRVIQVVKPCCKLLVELASLRDNIATVQMDIAGLKTDMRLVKTDTASLKTDMTLVRTDIAGLRRIPRPWRRISLAWRRISLAWRRITRAWRRIDKSQDYCWGHGGKHGGSRQNHSNYEHWVSLYLCEFIEQMTVLKFFIEERTTGNGYSTLEISFTWPSARLCRTLSISIPTTYTTFNSACTPGRFLSPLTNLVLQTTSCGRRGETTRKCTYKGHQAGLGFCT